MGPLNGSRRRRFHVWTDAERVRALERAIREHQLVTASRSIPRRPADYALYRHLGTL